MSARLSRKGQEKKQNGTEHRQPTNAVEHEHLSRARDLANNNWGG
jgi:hypothetical protein